MRHAINRRLGIFAQVDISAHAGHFVLEDAADRLVPMIRKHLVRDFETG